jgi:HD-like signal output (HDOD) protein
MVSANRSLVELIEERLQGDIQDLPVFKSVAVGLLQMLSHQDFRISEVIKTISEDQSLASQVLNVANSPYYGYRSQVATIKDAIVIMGAHEVTNLVMMVSQFDIYHSENQCLSTCMQNLWNHSLGCATGAKWLAIKTGNADSAATGFMSGLLHDIGKLVTLKILDDLHNNKEYKTVYSELLVNELLDNMHESAGYKLMTSWNLPELYCSIAGNHHKEDFDAKDKLLVIVRLSDKACREFENPENQTAFQHLISTPEAMVLNLNEMTLAGLQIAIEHAGKLALKINRSI